MGKKGKLLNPEHLRLNAMFGDRLRRLYEEGLTPRGVMEKREVAKLINEVDPPCSPEMLYKYELGTAVPDLYLLKVIGDIFKDKDGYRPYEFLLGDSPSPESSQFYLSRHLCLSKKALDSLIMYKDIADGNVVLNTQDKGYQSDFRLFIEIINRLLTHKWLSDYLYAMVRYIENRNMVEDILDLPESKNPIDKEIADNERKNRIEREELLFALKLKNISVEIAEEFITKKQNSKGKRNKGGTKK